MARVAPNRFDGQNFFEHRPKGACFMEIAPTSSTGHTAAKPVSRLQPQRALLPQMQTQHGDIDFNSAKLLASERFCKNMQTASAAGTAPPLPTTSTAMKAAASSTSHQADGESPLQPGQSFYRKLRETFGTFIDNKLPARFFFESMWMISSRGGESLRSSSRQSSSRQRASDFSSDRESNIDGTTPGCMQPPSHTGKKASQATEEVIAQRSHLQKSSFDRESSLDRVAPFAPLPQICSPQSPQPLGQSHDLPFPSIDFRHVVRPQTAVATPQLALPLQQVPFQHQWPRQHH
eukprot:6184156-Pleurochrysis_carterae.AAC.1